jgi:DNA mismatch repair protein MutS
VQVAKLAGLPASVITRAKAVLDALESDDRGGGHTTAKTLIDDLPLFSAQPIAPLPAAHDSAVEDRLETVEPDGLTPLDALALVYELKSLAKKD